MTCFAWPSMTSASEVVAVVLIWAVQWARESRSDRAHGGKGLHRTEPDGDGHGHTVEVTAFPMANGRRPRRARSTHHRGVKPILS